MLILFVFMDSIICCCQGQSLATFTSISTEKLWFSGFFGGQILIEKLPLGFSLASLSPCAPHPHIHILYLSTAYWTLQTTSPGWEGTCFEQRFTRMASTPPIQRSVALSGAPGQGARLSGCHVLTERIWKCKTDPQDHPR